jgi:hypothetical protein
MVFLRGARGLLFNAASVGTERQPYDSGRDAGRLTFRAMFHADASLRLFGPLMTLRAD